MNVPNLWDPRFHREPGEWWPWLRQLVGRSAGVWRDRCGNRRTWNEASEISNKYGNLPSGYVKIAIENQRMYKLMGYIIGIYSNYYMGVSENVVYP